MMIKDLIRRPYRWVALAIASVLVGPGFAADGVSPGAVDAFAAIELRCPTFSWEQSDDAALYEIVAYQIPEEGPAQLEFSGDTEALFSRVSGGATSWTPSGDQCFAPGGQYVWFVRAVYDAIDDQVIEASEWSDGLFFRTPAGPTEDELQHALDVLRRWESAGGSVDGEQQSANSEQRSAYGDQRSAIGQRRSASAWAPDSDSGSVSGSDSDSDSATGPSKSVPTASAAIRGEHPATSGEVYGVVGASDSPSGAGLGAVNTNGGPDLVLDGTSDERADAFLDETGWRRNSPNDETLTLENTGAGLMHLDVAGYVFADTADFEELKINGSTVIDDTGEWMGLGSTVPCASCVGSTDIADGGVQAADLADGAVTSAKILDATILTEDLEDDAVTGTKIADGAVGSSKLRSNSVSTVHLTDDAVTGAELADGAVGYRELASDSVRTNHILDGEVGTNDLASNAVDSSKILNGSVTSNDLADDTITYRDLADSAVTEPKVADGAITTAKIAAGSVTTALLASQAVETANLAPFAVTSAKIAGNAVDTLRILDGTITAQDVDPAGGIYASKSAVYVVSNTLPVPAYACQVATAECDDANDLPLLGFYSASVGGEDLSSFAQVITDWDSLTDPARYQVEICQNTSSAEELTGTIACVSVPGP